MRPVYHIIDAGAGGVQEGAILVNKMVFRAQKGKPRSRQWMTTAEKAHLYSNLLVAYLYRTAKNEERYIFLMIRVSKFLQPPPLSSIDINS